MILTRSAVEDKHKAHRKDIASRGKGSRQVVRILVAAWLAVDMHDLQTACRRRKKEEL